MQSVTYTIARPDTGAVLPQAVVTVFQADGVTRASLFNSAGTAIGNPVTANSNGAISFSAGNGIYILRAVSADGALSVPDISIQVFDLDALATAIAAGSVAGIIGAKYATEALMRADLNKDDATIALVYGDSDPLANDLYYKIGASGSGSWSGSLGLLAGLSYTYARLARDYANADTNTDITGAASGDRGAKYWSDRAEAFQAIVGDAADVIAARDAALLYKTGADAAQADAQAKALLTASDAALTSSNLAAVILQRAYVDSIVASLVPFSPIAQDQLFEVGGSVNINGTGMALPNSDNNIAISPRTVTGREALRGASATNTRKALAMGYEAMAYFNGYDSLGAGWRALFNSVGRNSVALGVHAGEATAYISRAVAGFGVRATGSITFTGLPSDGDTAELGGVTFTARAAPSTSTEFGIGANVSATIDNLLLKILGSAAASSQGVFFRKNAAGTALEMVAMGAGTWANAFTLAVTGAAMARSGATLTGGTTLNNDGNQDNYTGLVAIGIGAIKRFDMVFARAPYGCIFVTGQASVGATITLGLGLIVSTAAATVKRFTCVASGASGLQFNQGADAAAQIASILGALQAYQAANPTHTQMSAVDFYASRRGIEIVHKTANASGNLYRTEATGTNLSAQAPYLHGGYSSAVTPPIGIGMNSEAGLGSNIVTVGNSAARGAQANNLVALQGSSGAFSIGENNVYTNGSGQSIIGSNNLLNGNALGGAAVQTYMAVQSVSSGGLITLASPMTDPQAVIGRRFTVWQRNTTLSSDLIKLNGSNITNPGMRCTVVSPTQLQIIDFTDGTGAVGDGVYSVSGTVTNIEVALFYATLNYATSWGDAPESKCFHGGTNRHDKFEVRAQRLDVPNGRSYIAPLTAAAAHATGYIQFATGNGNFAADETVTINSVVFTAKAAATFATPATAMIRWFRIGADMHESLNNLIACIRNSDDDSASARLVRIATYWVSAQAGSGWRLNVRVTGRLVTGNSFTLSSSKTGATVSGPSGGTVGTLPIASAVINPAVIDGERRFITQSGLPVDAIYSSSLDDYQLSY